MNVRSIFRPLVVSVDGDERLADAAEYMTAAPAAVHLDADLHEVASTMFEFECRHLPVLSEDDSQVIGMVSKGAP
jgi:CBS domain-containing protein